MLKTINKNSATPAYQQLKRLLVNAMQSGELTADSKIPSENMLGKQYGIHRHTARTALKHLESEGLIASVPGRGWFVSSDIKLPKSSINAAPVSSNAKPLTIGFYGIATNNINSHFTASFFNELMQQSIANNIQLKMLSDDDMQQLKEKNSCNCNLDGLLWATPQPGDISDIEQLHNAGVNIIVGNRQMFGSGVPYIAIDQYAGTRELVTRLTKAGHYRIACITSDAPYRYVSERYRGYCDALHDAGLEVDEKLVLHIHDIENFPHKLSQFFAKSEDISAIFLAGEIFHSDTLNFLKQTKRHVPADISVVAFDKVIAHPTKTNIVCLEQPATELVQEIFNSFRQINQGEKISTGKVLNPVIVLGDSIKNINKVRTAELRTAVAV
ncbi:MAG: GntR family transcriptional regulator [Victivallaceae bacterium]|nr:GntR family transcriptional regulator [Victivallaceae bacterium]